MNGLSTGDWVLFGVTAYVAVVSLVRLMIRHRGRVAALLAAEVERERLAKIAEERRVKKEEKKRQQADAA
jgi:hypothetical protein